MIVSTDPHFFLALKFSFWQTYSAVVLALLAHRKCADAVRVVLSSAGNWLASKIEGLGIRKQSFISAPFPLQHATIESQLTIDQIRRFQHG